MGFDAPKAGGFGADVQWRSLARPRVEAAPLRWDQGQRGSGHLVAEQRVLCLLTGQDKPRGAALCPWMLLGRAGWGGSKVPVRTPRCPARHQEQNCSKSPSTSSSRAGGCPVAKSADGQMDKPPELLGAARVWFVAGVKEVMQRNLGLEAPAVGRAVDVVDRRTDAGSGSHQCSQRDAQQEDGQKLGAHTASTALRQQIQQDRRTADGPNSQPGSGQTDRRTWAGWWGNTDRSSGEGEQSRRMGTRSIWTDGWMQAQHFGCPTCGAGRRRTDGLELLARMPSTRPGRRCGRQMDGRTDGGWTAQTSSTWFR